MKHQQTKSLIKAIASGNVPAIIRLHEEDERSNNSVSVDGMYMAFFYLLEHGRPSGGVYSSLKYRPEVVTSESQFLELKRNWGSYGNDFTEYSNEALDLLIESVECWQHLRDDNSLELLEPYKNKLLW